MKLSSCVGCHAFCEKEDLYHVDVNINVKIPILISSQYMYSNILSGKTLSCLSSS